MMFLNTETLRFNLNHLVQGKFYISLYDVN